MANMVINVCVESSYDRLHSNIGLKHEHMYRYFKSENKKTTAAATDDGRRRKTKKK